MVNGIGARVGLALLLLLAYCCGLCFTLLHTSPADVCYTLNSLKTKADLLKALDEHFNISDSQTVIEPICVTDLLVFSRTLLF